MRPGGLRNPVHVVRSFGPRLPRYTDGRGGQAPRPGGAVMADLLDFVSLSLLPPWCWRVAADWLRRGDPPAAVARRLVAHARDDSDQPVNVTSLAAAAIGRAAAASITAIAWSDDAYPVALTTIADPPP